MCHTHMLLLLTQDVRLTVQRKFHDHTQEFHSVNVCPLFPMRFLYSCPCPEVHKLATQNASLIICGLICHPSALLV